MKTVKTVLTRRLRSNLLKKAYFSLTCDLLLCVEKIADREKYFGKKTTEHSGESLSFAQKAKNHTKDQSKDHPKGESSMRGNVRRNFRARGGRNNSSKRSYLQCKRCGKTGHTSD